MTAAPPMPAPRNVFDIVALADTSLGRVVAAMKAVCPRDALLIDGVHELTRQQQATGLPWPELVESLTTGGESR